MVHAANAHRSLWVEKELGRGNAVMQLGRHVEHVVSALTEDPPPRPQVLVVDFDAISAVDLLQLHSIREHGWCLVDGSGSAETVATRVAAAVEERLAP